MSLKYYILISLCLLAVNSHRLRKAACLGDDCPCAQQASTWNKLQGVNGVVFLDGIDWPSGSGDRGFISGCTPQKMLDYMSTAADNMIIIYGKDCNCCWIKDILYSGQAITQTNRVVAMKGSLGYTTEALVAISKIDYASPAGDLANYAAASADEAKAIALKYATQDTVAIYDSNRARIWIKNITKSGSPSVCTTCTIYFSGSSISPEHKMIALNGVDWNSYLGDRQVFSGLNFTTAAAEATKYMAEGYIFPYRQSIGYAWKKDRMTSGAAIRDVDIATFMSGDLISAASGIIGFRNFDFQSAAGDLASYECKSEAEALAKAIEHCKDVYTAAMYSASAQRIWIKNLRKSGPAVRKDNYVVYMRGTHMATKF